jgi:hypothetical protein
LVEFARKMSSESLKNRIKNYERNKKGEYKWMTLL